jgi:membrane protein
LIRESFRRWFQDGVFEMSAAIAFYAAFSIAPGLVLLIRLGGFLFGTGTSLDIESQISTYIGADSARVIARAVTGTEGRVRMGGIPGVLGFILLLLGSSAGFAQLLTAMNRVWRVTGKPGNGIVGILRNRFWSFVMVALGGAAFLASILVSTGIQVYSAYIDRLVPGAGFIWHYVDLGFSLAILTIMFALLFRFLPDARVAWRDVWVGATVTAAFFAGGKYLISAYLATISIESAFGAVGSFLVILIWIYASTAILLLGAEFTHIYAEVHGESVRPGKHAVRIDR